MEQVYLDINGDVLNDILGLKSDNRIDKVLQDIVEGSPIVSKIDKEKKDRSKKSKTKNKDETIKKMRTIGISRL